MTLVVARCVHGRIAIVADTLLTENGCALPLTRGALKSCCLPGNLCASYSGSPELAAAAFHSFEQQYPTGAGYEEAVRFFEASGTATNNEYLLAFGDNPKLVTIKDGCRLATLSKTHWIGDTQAFESFREYEHRKRQRYEQGRAVNAALFADELTGSPASDLHGVFRNVLVDRAVPTVGGFATVLSNRDLGFRYSVYSDVLLDWPDALPLDSVLQLSDKHDLVASGENDQFSVSQISSGYCNANIVAFYLLKGRLLIVLLGCSVGREGQIITFPNVSPSEISSTLNAKLGCDFAALCLVMSSRQGLHTQSERTESTHGVRISLFCEANTMSGSGL